MQMGGGARTGTWTALAGMPCSASAGSVAKRCASVSGSSKSRTASTKLGYLRTQKQRKGLVSHAGHAALCEGTLLLRGAQPSEPAQAP